MILKFKCHQFPNATIEGVKFNDGAAEVDSIHTDLINNLLKSPFVECLSTVAGGLATAIEEEIPIGTFKNRLLRKTKVEILKVCEDMGIPIGDASLPKDIFINDILKAKYPNEMKEEQEG